MTWQLAMVLQVLVSSCMTLFTRRVSLLTKHVFFGVGALTYLTIAACGWILGLVAHAQPSSLLISHAWPYLLIEGVSIPASWLVQYRLISYIGASNTVIVTVLNTLFAATAGIVFLHERLSVAFAVGALSIFAGILIALRIQPDITHKASVSITRKIALALLGAFLYGAGMYAEKQAISHLGVWSYAEWGWSMQAVGAVALFIFWGRRELPLLSSRIVGRVALLGILTSIAGGFYIYALSKGSLSHTIVATSAKAVIVLFLAAVLFRERNALGYRVAALACALLGLGLILS